MISENSLKWFVLGLFLAACSFSAPAQADVKPEAVARTPLEIVLVPPSEVTAERAAAWKQEGFTGVAVLLEERFEAAEYRRVAAVASGHSLGLFAWIEVGRNPKLAEEHPRWMASLGVHEDWQKRFPNTVPPKEGEVAKAFPWVPVWYQEAFDAHLKRTDELLKRLPESCRGVLVNDLQGGPSSCGCGNLQCRWATDYHVGATGTRIAGDDAPAKFVAAVRERARGKLVVPVWVTECEHEDMPPEKRGGAASTGLCGGVGCALGACPKDFTKQWSALLSAQEGPVGLLGLHGELDRGRKEFGEGAAWLNHAVDYLDTVLPANGGRALPHEKLWLVVQGRDGAEESTARRLALRRGAGAVIVARTKIDQSFEPRIIRVK